MSRKGCRVALEETGMGGVRDAPRGLAPPGARRDTGIGIEKGRLPRWGSGGAPWSGSGGVRNSRCRKCGMLSLLLELGRTEEAELPFTVLGTVDCEE